MAVKAAAAFVIVLTMLLGGCGVFGAKGPAAPTAAPAAMPLTPDNVAMVRAAVAGAKAKAPRADTRDDYVRLARAVYVAPWAAGHNAAATTEVALAQAKAGNQAARDYLTIMVYDIQLLSAMEAASLTPEDWRAVYVGSGVMTDAAFTGYMAMSRSGKVVP